MNNSKILVKTLVTIQLLFLLGVNQRCGSEPPEVYPLDKSECGSPVDSARPPKLPHLMIIWDYYRIQYCVIIIGIYL